MLGEKMGSMTRTATNKVLPTEGTLPKFEVTAQGSGTLVGVQVQTLSTYFAEMRADGSMYGELPNSGIVMAADGVATFRATGSGGMTEGGGSKFRGACYFETITPSLMSLNGKALIYEWDVDPSGNATWELWHWA
jgi:hypothetical protein